MVTATRGLGLSASRSNITDSSFCCTVSLSTAEKKDFVICGETQLVSFSLGVEPDPGWVHLLQGKDLAAGDVRVLLGGVSQSSDEQFQTVFVFGQQRGRSLVVLAQDEERELGLIPQQVGSVWAALLQQTLQERKQG